MPGCLPQAAVTAQLSLGCDQLITILTLNTETALQLHPLRIITISVSLLSIIAVQTLLGGSCKNAILVVSFTVHVFTLSRVALD